MQAATGQDAARVGRLCERADGRSVCGLRFAWPQALEGLPIGRPPAGCLVTDPAASRLASSPLRLWASKRLRTALAEYPVAWLANFSAWTLRLTRPSEHSIIVGLPFLFSSSCRFHSSLHYWILESWILDHWILDSWSKVGC